MKKYGFTLIELLGVMVLLSIIALITYPIVDKAIKKSREDAYLRNIENLKDIANTYGTMNDLGYSSEQESISFDELKQSGLIKNEDIKDPRTDEKLPGCILYNWDDTIKQYKYEYSETCVIDRSFNVTYGGSGYDYGYSIVKTNDGGYILIGETASNDGDITDGNNGESDVLVMKLNSNGSKVWDKTYGGSDYDEGETIIQTSDGGYILTGSTYSSDLDITDGNNGNRDILVIKLDKNGNKVWDKTYGGSDEDYGYSIIEDSNGDYVIAGYTASSDGDITDGNNGESDVLVMKINNAGNKVWDKTYGGSDYDEGKTIIQTSDGGYILTGNAYSSDLDITDGNNGNFDVLVIKLDIDGNKIWDKTYGGSKFDSVYSIIQTSDGSYILIGSTQSNNYDITDGNNGLFDILVMKLNSDGSKAWDKTYGGSSYDYGYSIIQTNDSGYILTGYTKSNGGDITDGNNGDYDILVMKLNSDGSKAWDKTFGDAFDDRGYDIIEVDVNDYVLICSIDDGISNINIIRLDEISG